MIRSYTDLDVWQVAIDLTLECYKLTSRFPVDEKHGLTAQIRRASVSIPANIAEGYGRDQTKPFIQFLRISLGSVRELETHLILVARLKVLPTPEDARPLLDQCERVSRMLRNLIRSLEAKVGRDD